jgi:MFS family permease
MVSLASILYIQQRSGSFADAGLFTGALLVGSAVGAITQSRIIDRLGPTVPLLVAALAYAVFAVLLVVLVELRTVLIHVLPFAVLTGAFQPAVPTASRALWAHVLPPGAERDVAYSYEAISLETFFILGPALAAVLSQIWWPGLGFAVAAISILGGTVTFALSAAVRSLRPTHGSSSGASFIGALASRGVVTAVMAAFGCSFLIGTVEVGVPTIFTERGVAALAGVLLSGWSISSVVAGFVYSASPWPRSLATRLPLLLAGFAGAVALLSLTANLDSLVPFVVVVLVSGALIAPQLTTNSQAVQTCALPGTATEGFGWIVTASMLGLAAGQAVMGVAVERVGVATGFALCGTISLVLALVVVIRRASLSDPVE